MSILVADRRVRSSCARWALLAFLCATAACARAPLPPRSADNLILVTIDTLRADHVHGYGYRGPTTPNLDALAHDGILYENAYAHTSWTPPSHASILTGLLPPEHGLRHLWTDRLSPQHVTLAEVLQAAGFATAAFVSAVPLRREVGLDQGFALYDDGNFSRTKLDAERPAASTCELFLAWLPGQAHGRFFAWLHFYEPHAPYVHHDAYDAPARAAGIARPSPADGFATAVYDYDSEIFEADRQIARVRAELARLGLADRTAMIVTADHGEYFGEHGLFAQHLGVYEPVVRVPLVLYDPTRRDAGTRIASVVHHVDIFPTALAMLGVAAASPPHARRLPPYGEPEAVPHVYLEHAAREDPVFGLREGSWKLVTGSWPEHQPPARTELYDLATDAAEQVDRAAAEPERRARLLATLAQERTASPAAPSLQASPDPETAKRLRALGYTD